MIDAFISTCDNTPNRVVWSRETIENLLKEPELRLTVIDSGSLPDQLRWFEDHQLKVVYQPKEGSLFRRFNIAAERATSEIYVFCDNDILPLREDWFEYGRQVMDSHPGYGYIVGRLENCDFSYDNGHRDNEVRSVAKGGGLGFIRRYPNTNELAVPQRPDPDYMDDFHFCKMLRDMRRGVGMFEQLYVRHLGKSESTR